MKDKLIQRFCLGLIPLILFIILITWANAEEKKRPSIREHLLKVSPEVRAARATRAKREAAERRKIEEQPHGDYRIIRIDGCQYIESEIYGDSGYDYVAAHKGNCDNDKYHNK